jgi:thioredoxin reductase (NADPH)
MKNYDTVIIGKGPAGISAALYTVRGGIKTLLIGSDKSYLAKAEKIENYYGFPNGISGKELLSNGIEQAKNIGTEIVDDEVTSLEMDSGFNIKTSNDKFHAASVLIATGLPPRRPKIDGVQNFEGKGISYCTTCDGFFYRNKKVGVLGNGNYAAQEAKELEPFTKDITVFTNGEEPKFDGEYKDTESKYKIEKRKIKSVSGNDVLGAVNFEDGEEKLDGLFIAAATASSVDFAVKLGVMVSNGAISVDGQMKTNIEGIFAAGDCTGGIKQVSVAVGEGAVAGKSMIEYLRNRRDK